MGCRERQRERDVHTHTHTHTHTLRAQRTGALNRLYHSLLDNKSDFCNVDVLAEGIIGLRSDLISSRGAELIEGELKQRRTTKHIDRTGIYIYMKTDSSFSIHLSPSLFNIAFVVVVVVDHFLYSAILRSRADSLRSHVILQE